MRAVIQRVKKASVSVNSDTIGEINSGLLVYIGIHPEDKSTDLEWIIKKLVNLKLFEGVDNKMSLNLKEKKGEILVISQFTLYASVKKGTRPSFHRAAPQDTAEAMYNKFIFELKKTLLERVQVGKFGADMEVSSVNDGPVTLLLDSHKPE